MRSMIKANTLAFNYLISDLNVKFQITEQKAKRYIKTNFLEKNILKNTKILDTKTIHPNLSAILVEYQTRKFIVIVGLKIEEDQIDTSHFSVHPSNAGLLTILLAEKLLSLAHHINGLQFQDVIMSQHKEDIYRGHDQNDILPFLQPFTLVEIKSDSILFIDETLRILTNITTGVQNMLVLNFEKDTLNLVNQLTLVTTYKIPYRLILNSLISANFSHSFLEIYRLIERMYPLNYIKEFYQRSSSQLNFQQFAKELESSIGWRPKEDEALKKIFDNSSVSSKALIKSVAQKKGYRSNYSNYIYKIRNSIVHFRMKHEEVKLTDEEWNDIIYGLLKIIDENYTKYSRELSTSG